MASIFSRNRQFKKIDKKTKTPNIILPKNVSSGERTLTAAEIQRIKPKRPSLGELERAQRETAERRRNLIEWQKGTGPRFDRAINWQNTAIKESKQQGTFTPDKLKEIKSQAKKMYENESRNALRQYKGTAPLKSQEKSNPLKIKELDLADRAERNAKFRNILKRIKRMRR
jgi:hypothetical protein